MATIVVDSSAELMAVELDVFVPDVVVVFGVVIDAFAALVVVDGLAVVDVDDAMLAFAVTATAAVNVGATIAPAAVVAIAGKLLPRAAKLPLPLPLPGLRALPGVVRATVDAIDADDVDADVVGFFTGSSESVSDSWLSSSSVCSDDTSVLLDVRRCRRRRIVNDDEARD